MTAITACMNTAWIYEGNPVIPIDTRPEMMPTLMRRVMERVPSNKSWIAKRPSRTAISMRITTAANVNTTTAQDARVVEVRLALFPGSNNKQSATFTTSKA